MAAASAASPPWACGGLGSGGLSTAGKERLCPEQHLLPAPSFFFFQVRGWHLSNLHWLRASERCRQTPKGPGAIAESVNNKPGRNTKSIQCASLISQMRKPMVRGEGAHLGPHHCLAIGHRVLASGVALFFPPHCLICFVPGGRTPSTHVQTDARASSPCFQVWQRLWACLAFQGGQGRPGFPCLL